jgi:hypothetical protein
VCGKLRSPDFSMTKISTYPCFTCGTQFEHGMGRFRGHPVPAYEFSVCSSCWAGSWDGWGPVHEPKIIAHMKALGRPRPARNDKGWLPREG